jgi:hypothetical protein
VNPVATAILASTIISTGLVAVSACDDAPATDQEVVAPVPSRDRADILRRAQQLVAVAPRELGYRLRSADARPIVRAQTDHVRRTITLFLRRGDAIHRVAHDMGHEVGHAYDERRMTATARTEYLARRGVPDAPWLPGADVASDLDSGAGDFAEVFALCAAASPDFRSTLAPRPEVPCDELPLDARRLISR